jgi:hypothetical protein
LFTDSELLTNSAEKYSTGVVPAYDKFKKRNLFVFDFFEKLNNSGVNSNLITHMDLEENSR